eukprot:CAMPEP_0197824104 /NCGR_PEP_ID=MMETSP1437-20131217/1409_1 /TAXON_ID=49252 ORGANISM="Eucampia antarctica, Strain CCMP1452" /NCGR_SAMPLE_ID=MMETSP1437 /ASSEMBLY_ACC=CAM_ASM_001096 /LENGTH=100 /DNA_ID=CAMNT_0043423603 /DNA_START=69 /DNA_END=371 /DNA_ORIENTATION=-
MGNVQVRNVAGSFLEVTADDGDLKRITLEGYIPVRRLFVKISDITSVSCKAEDNDVIMTLKNGVEYLLDELDEPTETYAEVCRQIVVEEYEEKIESKSDY